MYFGVQPPSVEEYLNPQHKNIGEEYENSVEESDWDN
jgi:hypothetical protein